MVAFYILKLLDINLDVSRDLFFFFFKVFKHFLLVIYYTRGIEKNDEKRNVAFCWVPLGL